MWLLSGVAAFRSDVGHVVATVLCDDGLTTLLAHFPHALFVTGDGEAALAGDLLPYLWTHRGGAAWAFHFHHSPVFLRMMVFTMSCLNEAFFFVMLALAWRAFRFSVTFSPRR